MLRKIWNFENRNVPTLDYRELIKETYCIDLSGDSYSVNKTLNDEYYTSFYIGINRYLKYATDNHKDKIDMKTMNIMTNDLKIINEYTMNGNIKNNINSLRRNKRKELICLYKCNIRIIDLIIKKVT